jgi:ring-1,2-phenylacetyl-CoA epoxidase subunit PaaD
MVSSGVQQMIPLVSPERARLVQRRNSSTCKALWQALDDVKDPEIPVLSLWDLGVLQDIIAGKDDITVVITPTYSGCPALGMMADEIRSRLHGADSRDVNIDTRLSPAWSTDWLDHNARQALREYGIAPPAQVKQADRASIACPLCGSTHTVIISEFGSTACKALHRCLSCQEPFDYFKSI